MKDYLLRTFTAFRAIIQQSAVLLVTLAMLLNLMPSVAIAANSPEPNSRLGTANATEQTRDQDYRAAKAERQEWQSRASSVRQDEENKPSTLGEKLNVDELAKGYDPEREAEKRSVPTP